MNTSNKQGKWQFWIDRGGTFTDIIARKPDGQLQSHKLLSENPERYQDSAAQGIRDILGINQSTPVPMDAIESIRMGTTVATNALLERNGERTLLVTTRGFKDALRIGYQNRPRLFDLEINLPEMLYCDVMEVDERLDAKGQVIQPLDVNQAKQDLLQYYNKGIRSVAIVLIHGYRYHHHEAELERIALEIGFHQVSVSHQVSPLMKLVLRGETTVVDAYLSPVIQNYNQQVKSELGDDQAGLCRLLFMQSNGGLTDAHYFKGKDAILSGPAGGVVAMARISQHAGFNKVIGFDMGGTSTDVSHFSGEFETTFESEVAGVRLRTPMMLIHTVAAGGGSVIHFDGARFRVGPDSAGATPGPASYRNGGPLTITDCNVLLGKIQPDYFPKVFGPNSELPLDNAIVEKKFKRLAGEISDQTGQFWEVEDVAEGFIKIAVDNMTNAIKKISIQRGYDISDYT
ncbi:MAG: 5-oxoprolinase, partial [Gammaproteobacteria bacterium]|nr:5-oxoprolinase [Gammaproteobacteria bacterium]